MGQNQKHHAWYLKYLIVLYQRTECVLSITAGSLWGAMENLNMLAFRILKEHHTPLQGAEDSAGMFAVTTTRLLLHYSHVSLPDADSKYQDAKFRPAVTQETELMDRLTRYCRLTMRLTFYATQCTILHWPTDLWQL